MTMVTLFNFLEPHLPWKQTLSRFDCRAVVLASLRLNLSLNYLSYQLGVSKSTISRIFLDKIDVMYVRMKSFVLWPDRESLRKKNSCPVLGTFWEEMCCDH